MTEQIQKSVDVETSVRSEDISTWQEFCALDTHAQLLQLAWISQNRRGELAVLWTFVHFHQFTRTLPRGEKEYRKDSSRQIEKKLAERLECNRISIGRAITTLLSDGLLGVRPHVDNVARTFWLNWPVLQAKLKIQFPSTKVLQLNFLASNQAELAVLCMLSHQRELGNDFSKVTAKTVQDFCNKQQLPININARAIQRSVSQLHDAGLIEVDPNTITARSARLASKVDNAINFFYATDFEKGLW